MDPNQAKNAVAAHVAEAGMHVKAHNPHGNLHRAGHKGRTLHAEAAAQFNAGAAFFIDGLLGRRHCLGIGGHANGQKSQWECASSFCIRRENPPRFHLGKRC